MNAAVSLTRAETIGVDALRALMPETGEVAAVFHRSLYVRNGGAWACVGMPDIGAGPLNILADLRCNWSTLVSVGAPVRVSGERMHIGRVPVDLAKARLWMPPTTPDCTADSVAAGLILLDGMIRDAGPPGEGLGCFIDRDATPVALEARAAAPVIAGLRQWFAHETELPDIAPLIGLGPGLTPSGDDYLAGALAALQATGQADRRNRLWAAIAPLRDRTSPISAAHLECAAEGRLAERQHFVLNAILTADRAGLESGLAAMVREPHTSHWDGLAGMASVLQAFSLR
jgi:hypothetical protein